LLRQVYKIYSLWCCNQELCHKWQFIILRCYNELFKNLLLACLLNLCDLPRVIHVKGLFKQFYNFHIQWLVSKWKFLKIAYQNIWKIHIKNYEWIFILYNNRWTHTWPIKVYYIIMLECICIFIKQIKY
jgi:hypothetical protein